MIMKMTLLYVTVALICGGCGKREPEPRTYTHVPDKDIQSLNLNLSVEIPPEDMRAGHEGTDRIKDVIRGALPNMRQHSLIEAWVNTAVITIQSKHQKGEALPVSMALDGVHPITLTWAETNRWTVNIRDRQHQPAPVL
jgi:hypothetical protein